MFQQNSYKYFTEYDVHKKLCESPERYYKFIKNSIKLLADGEATLQMPAKTIFTDPGASGDFRVMPCVMRHSDRVMKTVKIVGTNIRQEIVSNQITVGKAFIIDNDENFVSHIFEACLLSSARTAICACIAIELLTDSKRLSIVGAGRVGYYSAFFTLQLGLVNEVTISDINTQRAEKTVELLKLRFPDVKIKAVNYKEITQTDILLLATTSMTEIYHPDHFPADVVVSVGADIDFQHELSPKLVQDSLIFVDTQDSINYGDLRNWVGMGLITTSDIRDIFYLINHSDTIAKDIRRLFISTGVALFDNLTMNYIVNYHGD